MHALSRGADALLDRDKIIRFPHASLQLPGLDYVDEWLVPNFYFHLVTAYDILRHHGVDIGKADYMAHLGPRMRPAAG